ncbi:hypothetical protein [Nonomuraea sp. 10N515B]|uniref:hypothetical protein n=1 Tax=Nonomuraea sp. 10N515B TaxID=3457422 RepID=UPI003FCEE2CA
MGSAAAGLRLPLAVHLGISATLFSIVALVAYRFLLPGPEDAERPAEAQDLATSWSTALRPEHGPGCTPGPAAHPLRRE